MFKIAFVGNPNTGKSSIINALAGKHKLQVGNWSGVTFEKKVITAMVKNQQFELVDLPGLYSFDDVDAAAQVAQKEIIKNEYDLYINVIDVTSLTRNLYLTLMLLELNLPVLVLLNFSDLLSKYKYSLDIAKLSKLLRCPCLLVSAKKNDNIDNILDCAFNVLHKKTTFDPSRCFYFYDNKAQDVKLTLTKFLLQRWKTKPLTYSFAPQEKVLPKNYEFLANYYAIRILENANYNLTFLNVSLSEITYLLKELELSANLANKKFQALLSANDFIINKRSCFANNLSTAVIVKKVSERRLKTSLILDKIFINKWAGIPIFLTILFLVFILTFSFATPLQDLISNIINDFIGNWILHAWGNHWYSSLIVNGFLGGLGTILSFVPLMFILFLWINVLHESGYMARVSHLLDSILIKVNLNGKAIIPLILGFGCNVGSVYATRSIENQRQRKLTAMVAPFMSCSSRLPIYGLFVAALFGSLGGVIIFAMYIIGVFVGLLYCLLARIFFGKFSLDESQYFELPPYHMPSAGVVFKSSSRNIRGYLRNAATIILVFSVFIWIISYFPNPSDPSHSILAVFAHGLGYLFIPLGFGQIWQLVAAILPAIIAKEVTISTLGVLAANATSTITVIGWLHELSMIGNFLLQSIVHLAPNFWFNFLNSSNNNFLVKWIKSLSLLQNNIGGLRAFVYMMFMLLTIPCVTTLVALKQEFNYKVMFQSVAMGLATPYVLCLIVYQLIALAV